VNSFFFYSEQLGVGVNKVKPTVLPLTRVKRATHTMAPAVDADGLLTVRRMHLSDRIVFRLSV